jgi:hypothetical protein
MSATPLATMTHPAALAVNAICEDPTRASEAVLVSLFSANKGDLKAFMQDFGKALVGQASMNWSTHHQVQSAAIAAYFCMSGLAGKSTLPALAMDRTYVYSEVLHQIDDRVCWPIVRHVLASRIADLQDPKTALEAVYFLCLGGTEVLEYKYCVAAGIATWSMGPTVATRAIRFSMACIKVLSSVLWAVAPEDSKSFLRAVLCRAFHGLNGASLSSVQAHEDARDTAFLSILPRIQSAFREVSDRTLMLHTAMAETAFALLEADPASARTFFENSRGQSPDLCVKVMHKFRQVERWSTLRSVWVLCVVQSAAKRSR